MRVLARRGHSDRSWPVVVQMAEFVRQPLAVVGRQFIVVVDDDVVGRRDSALGHLLRCDQEIVPGMERE